MKIDCRKDGESVVYSLNDVTLKDAWECWRNPSYVYLTTLRRPLTTQPYTTQPYIEVVNRLDWIASVLASSLRGLVNAAVLAKMEARGEILPTWEDIPAAMRDGLGLDRIKFPRQFLARFVGEREYQGCSYPESLYPESLPDVLNKGDKLFTSSDSDVKLRVIERAPIQPQLGGLQPGQLYVMGGFTDLPQIAAPAGISTWEALFGFRYGGTLSGRFVTGSSSGS